MGKNKFSTDGKKQKKRNRNFLAWEKRKTKKFSSDFFPVSHADDAAALMM